MVFLNLRRNWNSRFDKTLLVQISGQWPDADKTEEVATQNLCLFVATAILIIAMLQLPSCYCHFDCHVATAMVIIAVNFVDKPARLIMILVFILFANSSQFAATSFKSIFFSSILSSRAKSIVLEVMAMTQLLQFTMPAIPGIVCEANLFSLSTVNAKSKLALHLLHRHLKCLSLVCTSLPE